MNGGTVEKPVHEDITYAELEYDVTRHEEYMDNLYNNGQDQHIPEFHLVFRCRCTAIIHNYVRT